MSNIGVVYLEIENMEMALQWFQKALDYIKMFRNAAAWNLEYLEIGLLTRQ